MLILRLAAAALVAAALAMPATNPACAAAQVQLAQAPPQRAPSRAQPAPPQAPAQGGADQQLEREIADLHRRLAITPAQQAQFDALAQAMRQNAQEMTALMQQQQQAGKPNAVEEVRTAQRFTQAEAAGLQRLIAPLEALYATLSDQQKRTADQAFAGPEQQQPPPAAKRR